MKWQSEVPDWWEHLLPSGWVGDREALHRGLQDTGFQAGNEPLLVHQGRALGCKGQAKSQVVYCVDPARPVWPPWERVHTGCTRGCLGQSCYVHPVGAG